MTSSIPAAARRLDRLMIEDGRLMRDGQAARPECETFHLGGRPQVIQVEGGKGDRRTRFSTASSLSFASFALLAADVATYLAVWAALAPFGAADGATPRLFALAAGVAIALFWSNSVYPGYRLHAHELLRRRVTVTMRVAVVACLGVGLLASAWAPPLLMAAFLGLSLFLQPVTRALVTSLLRRFGVWGETAAILGEPRAAVEEYFMRNWRYGIRPKSPGTRPAAAVPEIALITGAPPSSGGLARLRRDYAEVILLADLPGIRVSGLRSADLNGEIGLRIATSDAPISGGRLHRVLDLSVALCAAVAVAPLLAVAAIAIYVIDPGPVIYRQSREGLLGRSFRILKLRTMYRDADERLEALLSVDSAARAEWAAHFKLRNDPRILPIVGEFLRATSIDELPQLFNVIAGDMRIVGPRPFPHYHLSAMDADFRAKRCAVLPGLTGLWQISGRSATDIDRQQCLDDFYLDNRSFWLDAHILLNTVPAVLRGEGAY